MAASTSTDRATAKMAFPLLTTLLWLVPMASGEAVIQSLPELEPGSANELMMIRLSLSGVMDGDSVYQILPLTPQVGEDGSQSDRSAIAFDGPLVEANATSYLNLKKPSMAYLSCDRAKSNDTNDTNADPDVMVNQLINNQPRAIILYSMLGNACTFKSTNSTFQTIFTMTNKDQASAALNTIRSSPATVKAFVSGNMTATSDSGDGPVGNSSAVAMSILYSITGLITLLFLVIIGTGAVRAHRYPERYGPRSAANGRPRQSRAKGLARAVLDTIPIVKFGDSTMQSKPDPTIEMESQTARSSREMPAEARLGVVQQRSRLETDAAPPSHAVSHVVSDGNGDGNGKHAHASAGQGSEEDQEDHLGCSICTEDFTMGEDVRVLPCDHKFHPQCVDPWLMNVSGTCPLCRLDLRPQSEQPTSSVPDGTELPPPLDVGSGEDRGATGQSGSRTLTRLLDLPRLRHASVEERIEILRRHASQQPDPASASASPSTAGDSEERSRRQKLADRLRERFHIR